MSGGARAPLDIDGLGVASDLAAPTAAGRRDPQRHTRTVGAEVDEDVRKALAFLLRSTDRRPQTEAELREKLRAREVPDEVAEAAMEHARRLGAVDDEALARAWVEERGVRRGFGAPRLREELKRRGVVATVIDAALEPLGERDDVAAATELAQRRLRQLPGGLPAASVARRLAGYLARRGYPTGFAQRIAADVSDLHRRWD